MTTTVYVLASLSSTSSVTAWISPPHPIRSDPVGKQIKPGINFTTIGSLRTSVPSLPVSVLLSSRSLRWRQKVDSKRRQLSMRPHGNALGLLFDWSSSGTSAGALDILIHVFCGFLQSLRTNVETVA